ncbi:hypothetical protein DVH05_003500 [Phytophthora capsici]|nr:hypothetical protein DVH05_003500 [Phytophthora capsici]
MMIIFAVAGAAYMIEEEVTANETMNAVVARIAQKLHSTLEDLILVYKAVEPFEKHDAIVKEIQKGNLSAHVRRNLQSISMDDTVGIRACTTNRIHFVLDVLSRGRSPVHFYNATDRRYLRLAKSAKMCAIVSFLDTLVCNLLVSIAFSLTFAILAIVFGLAALLAFVMEHTFEQKANGESLL